MIFKNIEEIANAIKNPINQHALNRGKQIKAKHQLHIAGIGLNSFINKIQGIENEKVLSIRKSLSKEATVPVYANYLKPFDKIFSARGGSWNYNFSNDNDKKAFRNILNNVNGEYSITDWIANKWKDLVNIDPFGLAYVEVTNEGLLNLTYKAVEDIYDIKFTAFSDIEYVIFNPISKNNTKYYRVVDDKFDYTIKQQNDQFTIDLDDTYENYFQKVPAVFFSNREDKKSICKTTWIDESMIPADVYLLDYTIYLIVKLKVGIPYVWEYERSCPYCDGTGNLTTGDKCPDCNGTGKSKTRDVSDIIIVPTPANGDPSMTPPAGYVLMPSEVITQYENTLDREKKEIAEAIWGDGAVNETNQSAKTAFEINQRKESETTKLSQISRNTELFETAITDLFGVYYFPSTYKGSEINYGRRYKTDSIDIVLANYTDSLSKDANTEILDELIREYWYGLYENNEAKLQECLIRLKTKPFYHIKTSDLINYQISKKDYLKHVYYDMFAIDYEKTKSLSVSNEQEVQDALEQFIVQNYSDLLVAQNIPV